LYALTRRVPAQAWLRELGYICFLDGVKAGDRPVT
jgi:hypothetical protein